MSSDPQLTLKPGDLLQDRCRLEQEIGQGAFGVVFRAKQIELDEDVAIELVKRKNLTGAKERDTLRLQAGSRSARPRRQI